MLSRISSLCFALLLGSIGQAGAQVIVQLPFNPWATHTNAYNSLFVGTGAPSGYSNSGDPVSYEFEVNGRTVNDGASFAILAKSDATGPTCVGSAEGGLGVSTSFDAAGTFAGARGISKPVSLNVAMNGSNSAAVGGYFQTVATGLQFGSSGIGKYYVGGSWNILSGAPANYSPDGIVSAVIGTDMVRDSNHTWAGYFEGRGYFSDKVSIGTQHMIPTLGTVNTSNFKLFVQGGILTEQLLVYSGSLWPDYVFEPDYELMPLETVEQHISEVGHLPNTPSAKEVKENGLNLGDTAINHQEKIEELFLHVIQLNKDMKALQAENEALKTQVNQLNKAGHGK